MQEKRRAQPKSGIDWSKWGKWGTFVTPLRISYHPDLSVQWQCELLGVPRSTYYHRPLKLGKILSLPVFATLNSEYS